MSSLIATYASGQLLLEGLHSFLTVGHTLSPVFTGIGTGYCDDAIGTNNSVQEVITATFTSATAFNVTGTVSGAMGPGTIGTLFSHTRFQCTIQSGSTAWSAGDTITWTMTAPWATLNYTAGQAYVYQAAGNDGTRQVNVGWTVKSNTTGGYFGARIGAYPTWISNTFQWRQNTMCWWPLGTFSGSSCKLFVRASGQFVYAVARIGTYYMSMCAGLYDTLGTWDQQPFPYMVGGSYSWSGEPVDTSNAWLYSTTLTPAYASVVRPQSVSPFSAYSRGGCTAYIRTIDNYWVGVVNAIPGGSSNGYGLVRVGRYGMSNGLMAPLLDGTLPMWPYKIAIDGRQFATQGAGISPVISAMQGLQGYLPFVKVIPGYDNNSNLLVAESIFRSTTTRSNHIILQTSNDSAADSLYALEMI